MGTPKSRPKSFDDVRLTTRDELPVTFSPKTEAQQAAADLWPKSRLLFLLGPAGTGKTFIAMACALKELLGSSASRPKLMLSRSLVTVGQENVGLLPGTLHDKLDAWSGIFHDVFGDMTFAKWDKLEAALEVELVPVGMLRGRTVKHSVLLIDEAQDLTYGQLKCACTRLGRGGKIVFCGDPCQSSLYKPAKCPLVEVVRRLDGLAGVSTVRFTQADQVRDPLVREMLERL